MFSFYPRSSIDLGERVVPYYVRFRKCDFRYLLGLLGGGSARRKGCAHTGQAEGKCLPVAVFEPTIAVFTPYVTPSIVSSGTKLYKTMFITSCFVWVLRI
jgi:hypothetical protein